MLTAEQISAEIVSKVYTFTAFGRISSSSYEVLYQKIQNSIYDYVEYVYWNRSNIVKLVCIFNDENYEKIIPYYEKIFNSFEWNGDNAIPEGYCLYYFENADFEFCLPEDWSLAASDISVVGLNPENTIQLTVSVQEYPSTLGNVTAMEISSFLSTNKSNFMLQNFATSYTKATASFTHMINDKLVSNKTYLFCNGVFLYILQFDFYDSSIDESITETCSNLFREFITAKLINESESAE